MKYNVKAKECEVYEISKEVPVHTDNSEREGMNVKREVQDKVKEMIDTRKYSVNIHESEETQKKYVILKDKQRPPV